MNFGPSAYLGCHREKLYFVCSSPKGIPSGPGGMIDWGEPQGPCLPSTLPTPALWINRGLPSAGPLLQPHCWALYLKINYRLNMKENIATWAQSICKWTHIMNRQQVEPYRAPMYANFRIHFLLISVSFLTSVCVTILLKCQMVNHTLIFMFWFEQFNSVISIFKSLTHLEEFISNTCLLGIMINDLQCLIYL